MIEFDDLSVSESFDSDGDITVGIDDYTGWVSRDQVMDLVEHLIKALKDRQDKMI